MLCLPRSAPRYGSRRPSATRQAVYVGRLTMCWTLEPSCFSHLVKANESGRRDSNSRPPTWQAGALPLRHFRKGTLMITNPTGKGKTSEAVILATLAQLGKSILIPWGEERYDLALDEGGELVRIQCKTGHIRDGCVCF